MKKVLAFVLALTLLLAFVGCKKKAEEKVTIYVVTSQKMYVNGTLSDETTFTYDSKGRPLTIQWTNERGNTTKSEMTYDAHGNRTKETVTQIASGSDKVSEYEYEYGTTYKGDQLTGMARPYKDSSVNMELSYNKKGQLVKVVCEIPDELQNGSGNYYYEVWYSFAYDDAGRLISETVCTHYCSNGSSYERLSRVCYSYDQDGKLTEYSSHSAQSDEPVTPEEADTLAFENNESHHYFFFYTSDGKLDYVEDVAGNKQDGAAIYSNPNYTFDEQGNLLSVVDGNKKTEYTYTAMEVSKSDAEMAKRLMHGISQKFMGMFNYAVMDPLFWTMCPATVYGPYLRCPVYYLVPNPLWQINL